MIFDHIPILINNKLPTDEPTINKALGCLFNAGMQRNIKQLQRLPMVLMTTINRPTVLYNWSPILDR